LDRLEVLQKANAELGKKLMDAENTLQRRLTEHETELEDLQLRIDELKSELSATKKEEKELRSKEVNKCLPFFVHVLTPRII
jgi:chromosome segregation ATPase